MHILKYLLKNNLTLVSLYFLFSAQLFSFQIWIQPIEKSTIIDEESGKNISFRIITRDKSLGLIEIKDSFFQKKIILKNSNLKKNKVFIPSRLLKINGKNSVPLVKLDQENKCLEYSHSIATGKLPKSVRFIDENRIAVPLLYDNGIDIIDIETGKRVRLKPPAKFMQSRKYGFVETWVTKDKNKSYLWVTQMSTGYVHIFNLSNMQYFKSIPVYSGMPKILLSHPQTDLMYISNWSGRNLSVLSKKEYRFLYHIPIYGHPRGIAFSKDKKSIYAAQYGKKNDEDQNGKIIHIDLINQKPLGLYGTSGSQRHIVTIPEEDKLYVSNMAHAFVELIDTKQNKSVQTIQVFSKPNTIVLSKSKNYLFVSCRGTNARSGYTNKGPDLGRIYFIRTKTNQVDGFIYSGNQSTGLDISDDGHFLASSDFLDHRIRIYRILPECR